MVTTSTAPWWHLIGDTYWARLNGLPASDRTYLALREEHGWLVVMATTGPEGHRRIGYAPTLDSARDLAVADNRIHTTPTD